MEPQSSGSERILLFIPAYRCEKQIGRVLAQLRPASDVFAEVIVVDNRSPDGTVQAAIEAAQHATTPVRIFRNVDNYGLGGSHKVAFNYAIANRFDYCVVLHGDDQGDVGDLVPILRERRHRDVDCLLGARFMNGSRLGGYSGFRTFGNRVFNLLFSIGSGKRLYDLGSGLNLYRVDALRGAQFLRFGDDLTFNYYMILAIVHWGWRARFFPISWREADQISNVRLFSQAARTIAILGSYVFRRSAFFSRNHAGNPSGEYRSELIYENSAAVASRTRM